MITLDMRTVMDTQGLIYLVSLLVTLLMWVHARHNFKGLSFWVACFALGAIGSILIGFREVLPNWASIPLANSMVIGSYVLLFFGLQRFLGKKILSIYNAIVLVGFGVFVYIHCYYTYVVPDLLARVVNVSAGILILSFLSFCLLSWGMKPRIRKHATAARVAFILIVLLPLARIAGVGLMKTNDFMASGLYDTAVVLIYSISIVFLAISLILMVNRLSLDETLQVEEALLLSEQNFRDSMENSPLGIRIVSEDGKALYANQAFLDIYGYSSLEELEAVPGKQRYTPESYVEHRERVKKRKLGEHVPPNYEISIVRNDGQVRQLAVSRGEVLWDGEKQFQVVYQDITERKQAEGELLLKAQLLDNASEMILLHETNPGTKFLYVNKTMCDLLGYGEHELLAMKMSDIVSPIIKVSGDYKERATSNNLTSQFESIWVRKDGSTIPVSVVRQRYQHGDRRLVLASARDNTDRKQLEEELSFRASILDNSSELVYTHEPSPSHRLLYVNDMTCNKLGYSREELLTMKVSDIVPDPIKGPLLRQEMGNPRVITFETVFRCKDGSSIPIESQVVRTEIGGKVLITSSARDITERKQADEKIRILARFPDENPNPVLRIARDGTILYANRESQILLDTWKCNVGQRLRGYWLQLVSEVTDSGRQKIADCDCGERLFSLLLAPIVSEGYANIYSLDITDHRKAEAQVSKSRQEMRALSRRLLTLREAERTSLSRELHDELGQALTAVKLDLSWLSLRLPPKPETLQKIESMSQLIDGSMGTVRRISSDLRPGLLDDLGLQAAMEWYLQEFQQRAGIKCRATFVPEDLALEPELATAIFRILQEAVTNIARHAQATRIGISLREKAGIVELRVKDNGIGIDPVKLTGPRSLGIIGMRERASALGGKIEISGSSKGTTVTVRIPQDMGGG
jgi:PAS domain S-box-containing protein